MNLLAQAIKLAAEVHVDQTDKGGEPYILHCLAVMDLVRVDGDFIGSRDIEAIKCAAVLHDVMEDFKGTAEERLRLKDFIYQTFGDRVYSVLERLTRLPDEDYETDYIARVEDDWIARRVKIADLTHNMDPRRLPAGEIGQKDFERWEKYRRAIVRLERWD